MRSGVQVAAVPPDIDQVIRPSQPVTRTAAPKLTVRVTCPGCAVEAVIRSRTEFGTFEERHVQACRAFAIPIDGSMDDVISLPPY